MHGLSTAARISQPDGVITVHTKASANVFHTVLDSSRVLAGIHITLWAGLLF
jgi:hypothetical protein